MVQPPDDAKPAIPSFTEASSESLVIARLSDCGNERFKEIIVAVIRHLHAAIKEVELTEAEWTTAIDFLTRTGKMCGPGRQEFVLLSDTLGATMLVDAINHRKPEGATETTVLGPFHVEGAPHRAMGDDLCLDKKGIPLFMSGRVLDVEGRPLDGAVIDTWMTNEDGFYDVQQPGLQPQYNLRGIFTTGSDGRYWFRSAKPRFYPIPTDGPVGEMLSAMGRHPFRPAHIHFIVGAPGYQTVTTHVFMRGDPYLESDAVFGVKDALVIDFVEHDGAQEANPPIDGRYVTANWDFALVRSS